MTTTMTTTNTKVATTMTDRPPRADDRSGGRDSGAANTDEATRQRLAELTARRSRPTRVAGTSAPGGTPGVTVPVDPTRRPTRRHPALTARILTAGLSTALMLGIIADLGANAAPALDASPMLDESAVPVQPAAVASPTASTRVATIAELTGQPIQLTAAPAVRTVDPAPRQQPAPMATTHGSR